MDIYCCSQRRNRSKRTRVEIQGFFPAGLNLWRRSMRQPAVPRGSVLSLLVCSDVSTGPAGSGSGAPPHTHTHLHLKNPLNTHDTVFVYACMLEHDLIIHTRHRQYISIFQRKMQLSVLESKSFLIEGSWWSHQLRKHDQTFEDPFSLNWHPAGMKHWRFFVVVWCVSLIVSYHVHPIIDL